MNGFMALYRKELNYLVKPFAIIITAHLVSFIYLLMQDTPVVSPLYNNKTNPYPDYYFVFYLFLLGCMVLFPIMLAFSWFEEWNNKTSLQLLSLPTSRKMVAWSKFAAALTYCLFYTGNLLAYFSFYDKYIIHIPYSMHVFPDHTNAAIIAYSIVIWLSGVVSVTAMTMTSAHKHKYALALGSVAACIFITFIIMQLLSLPALLFVNVFYMFANSGIIYITSILILACILIMFAGQTILERHQEA